MNQSNWTGRFSRTSREAFGHSIEFERPSTIWGGYVIAFSCGFLLAVVLCG